MSHPIADARIIDAREHFRPPGIVYKVQIRVSVNARFLLAVVKCLLTRKELRINHTFTNDPLLNGDFE